MTEVTEGKLTRIYTRFSVVKAPNFAAEENKTTFSKINSLLLQRFCDFCPAILCTPKLARKDLKLVNTSAIEVSPTSSGRRRSVQPPSPSAEPHYSARMLAELWKLNIRTVRRIFNDAPGVIKVGSGKAGDRKRGYFTLRIPASVAEREHQRLAAAGSKEIAQ